MNPRYPSIYEGSDIGVGLPLPTLTSHSRDPPPSYSVRPLIYRKKTPKSKTHHIRTSMAIKRRRRTKTQSTGKFSLRMHHFHPFSKKIKSGRLPLASFKMRKGAAVAEWLSSWLAEQEVRGSIPRISEIGYLPLPSRDMAEIPLKRRKSSIQPTKSRWEKLSHVTPYIKGKLQIHVPSTSALLSPKINLKCQKKKWHAVC